MILSLEDIEKNEVELLSLKNLLEEILTKVNLTYHPDLKKRIEEKLNE